MGRIQVFGDLPTTDMTLLCKQGMNRLHQGGVTGARWPRGSLIGPQHLANVVWWCVHLEALPPCEVIVQVTPDARDRAQRWTVGWSAHQAHVGGDGEP